MTANDNMFLAVFLGSETSPRLAAWNALSDAERGERQQKGMASWRAWMDKHQSAIASIGGPLGKTKRIASNGVEDVRNAMTAYVVVRAESQAAAAKMFEGHPHFTIFPGESIEVMPVLPIPGG